jgi:NAD(P)-dependent dehydrogenase (short-subunit alcohol dehydrogenase family)
MKTILITGANRGIGFETAIQLGQKGHRIIAGCRSENHLAVTLNELQKNNISSEGLLLDVSSAQSIEGGVNDLKKRKLFPDVLINNAATLFKSDSSLIQNETAVMDVTLKTNSIGPLLLIRSLLRLMPDRSRIINISSGGGSMSDPVGGWAPAYCVSKSMLNAITRQLAVELANRNISVNAVCPGWVQTKMGGKSAPRPVSKGAETPVWLASEAGQELTGKFFRDKKEIPW